MINEMIVLEGFVDDDSAARTESQLPVLGTGVGTGRRSEGSQTGWREHYSS
jgi:hypothetical protein